MYCAKKHAAKWLCVLLKGHEGDHLSLDNSRVWKGTPGFPVIWSAESTLTREQTDELAAIKDPMTTQALQTREEGQPRAAAGHGEIQDGKAT